jgi:hypothetical protein
VKWSRKHNESEFSDTSRAGVARNQQLYPVPSRHVIQALVEAFFALFRALGERKCWSESALSFLQRGTRASGANAAPLNSA